MRASNYLTDKAKETIVESPDIDVVEIRECPNFYVIKKGSNVIDEGMFIDVVWCNEIEYLIYKR